MAEEVDVLPFERLPASPDTHESSTNAVPFERLPASPGTYETSTKALQRPTSSSRRSSLPTSSSPLDDGDLLRARKQQKQRDPLVERVSSDILEVDGTNLDIEPAKSTDRPVPAPPRSLDPANTNQALANPSRPASASRRSSLPALPHSPVAVDRSPLVARKSSDADSEVMIEPRSPLVPRRPESLAAGRAPRPRPDPHSRRSRSTEDVGSAAIRPYQSSVKHREDGDNDVPVPCSPLPFRRPSSARRVASAPLHAPDLTTAGDGLRASSSEDASALEHTAVASPGRIRASRVPHLPAQDSQTSARPSPPQGLDPTLNAILQSADAESISVAHPPSPLMALRPASARARPGSPRCVPKLNDSLSPQHRSPSTPGSADDASPAAHLGAQHAAGGAGPEEHASGELARTASADQRPSRGRRRVGHGGDSPLGAVLSPQSPPSPPSEGAAHLHGGPPPPRAASTESAEGEGRSARQAAAPLYVRPATSALLRAASIRRRGSLPEPLSAPRAADDLGSVPHGSPPPPDDAREPPPHPTPSSASPLPSHDAASGLPPSPCPPPATRSGSGSASQHSRSPPPSPFPFARRRSGSRPSSAGGDVEDAASSDLFPLADSPGPGGSLNRGLGADERDRPPPSPLRSVKAEPRESFAGSRGPSVLAVDVGGGGAAGSDGQSSGRGTGSLHSSPEVDPAAERRRSPAGSGGSPGIAHPGLLPVPVGGPGPGEPAQGDFLARTMASHRVLAQRSPPHAADGAPHADAAGRGAGLIDFKSLTLHASPPGGGGEAGGS